MACTEDGTPGPVPALTVMENLDQGSRAMRATNSLTRCIRTHSLHKDFYSKKQVIEDVLAGDGRSMRDFEIESRRKKGFRVIGFG